MPLTRARYDGHASWYDSWNKPHAERNAPDVLELLGPGDGLCLDIGCGGGLYFGTLAAAGRTVVGLDRSADHPTSASGLACVITRWPSCLTRSSAPGWSSSTSPSWVTGRSRSASPSGPASQRAGLGSEA
jgi:hypothetical protein